MATTAKAAPIMLGLPHTDGGCNALQHAFEQFTFWGVDLRGGFAGLAFLACVWALVAYPLRSSTGDPRRPSATRGYVWDMRFAVSIPQLDTGALNLDELKAYLARAEELGFAGGWVMEQTIGPTPMLAPLETLAYAAACTTELRLGVAVLVVPEHDPLQLAASITAVDRLSAGRLDVGISPGGGFRPFEAFGVARETFVGYFVEALELMKAAWADQTDVSFHGRFRDVRGLAIQPKPVQRPHPPIWFGASSQRALARAARLGDAFLGAGSTSTARFADQVVTLRSELAAQGRDPASYPIGKRVYLAVDDDADRARAAVSAGLDRQYGGTVPGIEHVPVAGTSHDVVAGLREVADAGAELLVLNPLGSNVAEDREQLERLAAEVIPQLS